MALKERFIGVLNAALPEAWRVRFSEAYGAPVDRDEEGFRKLTADVKRDLAPMTQSRMQKMGHYLWEQNLLANRLIELPVAYLLAEGVKLTVKDTENQKLLDRFWKDPINDMDLKLPKKVRELAIFGEQCYPAFVNSLDGMVRIGYLDPSLIETVVMDPDNREQPIGVVTCKDRKGNARRYRVIINGPEEVFTERTREIRQSFSDGDAFYFRVNDLSSGSRGRSDLLAQADWLDAYDTFMFGEVERYGFLRAFVWDLTLKGATPAEVAKRAKEFAPPAPGSAYVHNDSEELEPKTPELAAVDTSEGARLIRNHALGGATMPEHWYGGAENVNRSTGSEMSEPTLKMYSMRQRYLKHMLESIGRYVLLNGAGIDGKKADFADPKWAVEAEFPELAVKDTTKYASALQQVAAACVIAITQKLMSRKFAARLIGAIAERLGVEANAEQELLDAEADATKTALNDVFTEPPADTAAAA